MREVTDENILKMLEQGTSLDTATQTTEVTDPNLLALLNTKEVEDNALALQAEQVSQPVSTEEISTEDSMLSSLIPSLETGLSVLSSVAAEPLAGLWGTFSTVATGGNIEKGVKAIENARKALTYTPETEESQAQLQSFGEALQPVAEKLQQVNESLGDFAYQTTGSPAAAAAAYSLPTLALELLGVKGLKAGAKLTPAQIKARQAQKAMLQDEVMKYSSEVADVKLNNKGVVVPDKTGEQLLDYGFKRKDTAVITNSTRESKQLMRRMLDKFDAGESNDIISLTKPMSTEIGGSVSRRLGALSQQRKQLGKSLDAIGQTTLSNKTLDIKQPLTTFFAELHKDFGIKPKIKGNGKLSLDGVDTSPLAVKSFSSVKNLIEDTVELINQNTTAGSLNSLKAHKFKKTLDELADAQKASEVGLSNNTHRRLLELRRGINNALRQQSPEYAKVNNNLSKTIEAMKPFDKYLKQGKSWEDSKVSEVVGSAMNNLSADSTAKAGLRQDIAKLEAATRELGIKFNDDPRALMSFKSTVESFFKLDEEALLKSLDKYDEAIQSGLLDAGASMAVGNKFGVVHDLARLQRLGVSKNKARKLVEQKIKAKQYLKKALEE